MDVLVESLTNTSTDMSVSANMSNLTANSSTMVPVEEEVGRELSKLIPNEIRDIIIIINMAIICQIISAFGIFANLVNIVVFIKQGFRESMTVTLTGLAVADLGISACSVWLSICYNPLFQDLRLPFKPLQIVYLTAGLPRLSCARVSSWVLAMATFERCLCIAMPLKVKQIITPRRTFIYVLTVFIVMTASVAPVYYTTSTEQFFDEAQNRSYLILSFTEDRQKVDSIVWAIGVSLSVISFVSVAVCTVILVYNLRKTAKWRESIQASAGGKVVSDKVVIEKPSQEISVSSSAVTISADLSSSQGSSLNVSSAQTAVKSSTQNGATTKKAPKVMSDKNKKAGKMVSLISIIFIVCYLPNTLNQLVMSMVIEYTKNGRYINTNQVFWSVGFVAEAFNAFVNIFMYYTMSSRYRETLQGILKWCCGSCCSSGGGSGGGSSKDDDDGK